ncbi:MAG TPA: porin, partial [Bdellovibrionota bacterium]|nr:porin [Bdellovibrionota bacterium]
MLRLSVILTLISLAIGWASGAAAEDKPPAISGSAPTDAPKKASTWDKYSIRGYTQLRYSRVGNDNPSFSADNDRSVGTSQTLFVRRARLVISGNPTEQLYIYIQPELAAILSDTNYMLQMRDLYGDFFFDSNKEFRVRAGLSKVPVGFEALQSSSIRAPLERTDSSNTAVRDERDTGIFFYYTPSEKRALFKKLVDEGLKGSGDYGVVGFGVYTGQTLSRRENNENLHTVARISYPHELGGGQIIEGGVSGYTGLYNVTKSATAVPGGGPNFRDQRVVGHLVLYPQPIGIQGEFHVGRGPELSGSDILVEPLHGGYLMAMYKLDDVAGKAMIPFARYQYYSGGRKTDTNSPFTSVHSTEVGIEWQVHPSFEVTA